jgi:streptogramin lyase
MKKNPWFLLILGVASLAMVWSMKESGQVMETSAYAAAIAGMGTISGMVKAPKEFKAAKVFARNVDKNITYMVFTENGRFRAVDLFPGNYEVSVAKNGFTGGDVQKITIKAGGNTTVDLSLQAGPTLANQGKRPGLPKNVPLLSYDELYPPGEGRTIIEKTCIRCHGGDFLPSKQWSAAQWNAGIDLMQSTTTDFPARISPTSVPQGISPQERETLVAYLVKNFGPDSQLRGLEVPEMPVDEEALGKAMFIEYHLPALANNDQPRRFHDPHLSKNGDVWYTDTTAMQIGKLDPRTGIFTDYPIRNPNARGHGITQDAAGQIWYSGHTAFGRVDSRTGEMTFYPYESEPGKPSHGNTPVVDSKQNVWTTLMYSNELAKWDRKTEKVSKFKLPTPYSSPYGADIDKNDNIYVAEWFGCKIAKFDTKTEKWAEYLPTTKPCTMRRVSVDFSGMVWYALDSVGKIGMVNPNTGQVVAEYTIPLRGSYPYDIKADHLGNMWIADSGQGGALIKFDTKTAKFTYYPAVQRTDMPKIEVSGENSIWYTTRGADAGKDQAAGVLYPDMTKITTLGAYY